MHDCAALDEVTESQGHSGAAGSNERPERLVSEEYRQPDAAQGDVGPRLGQEPQHGVHPIVDAGEPAADQLRSQSIELLADAHRIHHQPVEDGPPNALCLARRA